MIVIHRDIPGLAHEEHEDCICRPHLVDDDDPRTAEQLEADLARAERPH